MGYALVLVLMILVPLLLGKTTVLLLNENNKRSICLEWIIGNQISMLLFSLLYLLNAKYVWKWIMLFLFLVVLLWIMVKKEKIYMSLIWARLLQHKVLLVAVGIIAGCIILSIVAVDHNYYGNDLIGYEYLFRLETGQTEYYVYADEITEVWKGLFENSIIMYWIMQINISTMLPPLLFAEGIMLLWIISMTFSVLVHISQTIWGDVLQQDIFVIAGTVFFGLSNFCSNLEDWQIYIGPWEPRIILMSVFVPLFFGNIVECITVEKKNRISVFVRTFLTGICMAICISYYGIGAFVVILVIITVWYSRRRNV